MAEILSPMSDGFVLTPEQRKARETEKRNKFIEGLKKLEEETGMTMRVSLMYTPEGIFPGARIVPKIQGQESLVPGEKVESEKEAEKPVEKNEGQK